MNILLRFRHGLGDAVQLTAVLRHLRHYHADWNVDVAALVGKHTAYGGLCRKALVLDRDPIPSTDYQQVFDLDWHECGACYTDWPSTKVERCLLEVFGLRPIPDLCRYVIQRGEHATQRARDYLKSICPHGAEQDRFPVALIHYQGNTSGPQKDIPEEVVSRLCEDLLEWGAAPVILDWDYRSPLVDGRRIHNPHTNLPLWGGTGTGDAEALAALIELSSLVIGIDSGPLHVAGATTTPTIGVWTAHHPLHYFGPAENVWHLVPARHMELLRGDRGIGADYFARNYRRQTYENLYLELAALAESLFKHEDLAIVRNRKMLRQLRATSYDEQYYREHQAAGLDYRVFGDWHRRYGRWFVESLGLRDKKLLDVGCACGAVLLGLAQAGASVWGVDLCEHMIRLGRESWPELAPRLSVMDAANLHGFTDGQFDVIHTAQVAEHWKPTLVPHILAELHRVSAPGGLLFGALDTEELFARQGRDPAHEDPTHVCIRSIAWWHEQLQHDGWRLCTEEFEPQLRAHPESMLREYDWDWFIAQKV